MFPHRKLIYEADARISNLMFVTVNDVIVSFDPSLLVVQVADDDYDFLQPDAGPVEALGKHRRPQKIMDTSLHYPINMICSTGIDDAAMAVFRRYCRLSNPELLDSDAAYNSGLRRLVRQWHRDLASSFKPHFTGGIFEEVIAIS